MGATRAARALPLRYTSRQFMDYKETDVWQHSKTLAVAAYRATAHFPDDEKYGMCAQMRRAAVSIPSNVAEGEGRGSTRDHLRFLALARGSLYELETQIAISIELGYLEAGTLQPEIKRAAQVINGTIRSLAERLSG